MCRMQIEPGDPKFGNIYTPEGSRPKEIVWSCPYNEVFIYFLNNISKFRNAAVMNAVLDAEGAVDSGMEMVGIRGLEL
jgi:hypothetical protein